jgi:NAD(P)-dependent dehydrogenase (short-subunit alcohol dehydrogenase family)
VVVWDVAGDRDVPCDVTEPLQVEAAMAETYARWGAPGDVTITAGVGHAKILAELDPDEFERIVRVNTRGPLLVMRAVAAVLADESATGSIVVTSSISGRVVDRGMGAYCASKAALDMLVRVAALEWAPLGIRVNAVAPGVTETPMLGPAPRDSGWLASVQRRTALARLGTASDIAEAIEGLHAMTWVTGQVVDCDGGLSLHSPIDSFGEHDRR